MCVCGGGGGGVTFVYINVQTDSFGVLSDSVVVMFITVSRIMLSPFVSWDDGRREVILALYRTSFKTVSISRECMYRQCSIRTAVFMICRNVDWWSPPPWPSWNVWRTAQRLKAWNWHRWLINLLVQVFVQVLILIHHFSSLFLSALKKPVFGLIKKKKEIQPSVWPKACSSAFRGRLFLVLSFAFAIRQICLTKCYHT